MKLSEAIVLGDTLKRCEPEVWISEDGSCGCALGGALLAAGVEPQEFNYQYDVSRATGFNYWPSDMPSIMSRWPWITGQHLSKISDLYRYVAKGEAAIEDVAAYVRTVEPPEVEQPQAEMEPVHAELA